MKALKKEINIFFGVIVGVLFFLTPCFAEEVYFYHVDPTGTPLAVSNSAGSVVWEADYKPFGEVSASTGTPENKKQFIGKEKDDETGLLYFGARYMDADTGRFITPDPLLLHGGGNPAVDYRLKLMGTTKRDVYATLFYDPQNLNPYSYVKNNPMNFIDNFGLYWEYSQSSGQMDHIDNKTGVRTSAGKPGYSGKGEGKNNPDKQNVPFGGPIPQGTYDTGKATSTKGPVTIPLIPRTETDTFGRDNFRIHGDNSQNDQSASEGCIIMNRNVRDKISNSTDRELRVVK